MKKPVETPLIWNVEGYELKIMHPKKLYWPEQGYTKLDLLEYYDKISPVLLPYLKNRPVTIKFFPNGIDGFSFYKRDFEDRQPIENFMHTFPYKEVSRDKTISVLLIDAASGLLWMASRGGIEYHLWSSTIPRYSHPDLAIIDLDISEKGKFKKVLQVACYIRDSLEKLDIKCFPKTSGGTGLHLYIPISNQYSFKQVRDWVQNLGNKVSKQYPKLVTAEISENRTHYADLVVIDYLQNVISRNTAAPYTVRAYPNAPVSTPLTWQEVEKAKVVPLDFTLKNVPERLEKLGDIFAETLTLKQELPM